MRKIPSGIKKLYQGLGLRTYLYAKIRWRICPFEEIEKYLPQSGVIFDIGCGYGMFSHFLSLKSADRQIIGIDNSAKRLNIAKSTLKKHSNIEFIQGDVRNLDLPKCQGAVMSDVLHHLSPIVSEGLLNRIFNRLSPSGRLVIEEVDNKPFWKYVNNLIVDNVLYPTQTINFKPSKQWRELLEKIGFQVEIIPAYRSVPFADVILVCTK